MPGDAVRQGSSSRSASTAARPSEPRIANRLAWRQGREAGRRRFKWARRRTHAVRLPRRGRRRRPTATILPMASSTAPDSTATFPGVAACLRFGRPDDQRIVSIPAGVPAAGPVRGDDGQRPCLDDGRRAACTAGGDASVITTGRTLSAADELSSRHLSASLPILLRGALKIARQGKIVRLLVLY